MYNPEKMVVQKPRCVLAVDWGSKRIGVAISDLTGKIARPLGIVNHKSRSEDAKKIVMLSMANSVDTIIMGVIYDDDNNLTPSGRSANRLADEISILFGKQVILWDEAFTTFDAKRLQIEKGVSRTKRIGHQDEIAAVLLLEDYLEKNNP
jgi:putative holliday junction resolvase